MAHLPACGSISLDCFFASVCSYTSPDKNFHRTRSSRISSTIAGEKNVYGGDDRGIDRRNCSRVAVVRVGLFARQVDREATLYLEKFWLVSQPQESCFHDTWHHIGIDYVFRLFRGRSHL